MTKKTKKLWYFWQIPLFHQNTLNLSNLVKTQRNSLLFFVKYSKLNKEHGFDAKNIIKCLFKDLLSFLSKKMTIFDLSMILG
jgi:hypothetical protein